MKTMKKYALTILTLLPIKSIATVAQSAVLDVAGEEQNSLLLKQLKHSRSLLLPKGAYSSTLKEAKIRLQHLTGITDEKELNDALKKHLEILNRNGILTMDENKIVSGAPSFAMN